MGEPLDRGDGEMRIRTVTSIYFPFKFAFRMNLYFVNGFIHLLDSRIPATNHSECWTQIWTQIDILWCCIELIFSVNIFTWKGKRLSGLNNRVTSTHNRPNRLILIKLWFGANSCWKITSIQLSAIQIYISLNISKIPYRLR